VKVIFISVSATISKYRLAKKWVIVKKKPCIAGLTDEMHH
jgi:hypothetical protein